MSKIACSYYDYTSNKVTEQFDNYRIVVISDLHCCDTGNNNLNLINKIKKISPDIIIIAGDMVTDHGLKFGVARQLLTELIAICPVYYGPGNHEHKLAINPRTSRKFRRYIRYVKKLGIKYLNNKSAYIKKDDNIIRITGLDIGMEYYQKIWSNLYHKTVMTSDYINSLIKPCSDNRLELLIAHNPDYIKYYAEYGADIVVSGHIHGGIMVLPVIGGVISPTFRPFPYYDFGVFRHKNTTMYLTRGLGSHTIPLRINNPPEILVITLHTQS